MGGDDRKVDRAEAQYLSREEKSVAELYESWRIEEVVPGIVHHILDFGRSEYRSRLR